MRIARREGAGQPDQLEELGDTRPAGPLVVDQPVHGQRFADRRPDRSAGIERRERILEDQADPAPQLLAVGAPHPEYVGVAEECAAGVGFHQAGECGRDRRLPRAGLADQSQRGAAPDLKGEILHRVDGRAADRCGDREPDVEALDVEQYARIGRAGAGPSPPTSGRASRSSRV